MDGAEGPSSSERRILATTAVLPMLRRAASCLHPRLARLRCLSTAPSPPTTLLLSRDDALGIVTVAPNRPRKANAINRASVPRTSYPPSGPARARYAHTYRYLPRVAVRREL